MAAALLRRRANSADSSSGDGGTAPAGMALELAALWVEPTLEDRPEVAWCLFYFLLQYLLASGDVTALHEGAQPVTCWYLDLSSLIRKACRCHMSCDMTR